MSDISQPLHQEPKPVLIAKMMGLPRASQMDNLGLSDRIAKGLDVRAVEGLAKKIAPEDPGFKYRLVSRATLDRAKAKKQPLSKDHSERLYELAKVWGEVLQTYGGDVDKSRRFLDRPHQLLKGKRPLDLAVSSTAGADVVIDLLRHARAGVAV